MNIRPNVKLGSNILILMGIIFVADEVLKYLILSKGMIDCRNLFWSWLLIHKLTLYSIFAFYPVMLLMGRHNNRFGISFLLVIGSTALVGIGGYILKLLSPEYALNNISRDIVYQLYLGIWMLGILGRLGKFDKHLD